jgi:hypothetical protein
MPGLASYGAPPLKADQILELLAKHKGTWWFVDHWAPFPPYPDSFVHYVTTGSASIRSWDACSFLDMMTGNTSGSIAEIMKEAHVLGPNQWPTWNTRRLLTVHIDFISFPETGYVYKNQIIHIDSGVSPVIGYLPDRLTITPENKYHHVGFKVIDDKLYGTVGNGTAESVLYIESFPPEEIPGEPGFVSRRLDCMFDPAAGKCTFYVNLKYVGEITTNLPTGEEDAFRLLDVSIGNTAPEYKEIYLNNARVVVFEA